MNRLLLTSALVLALGCRSNDPNKGAAPVSKNKAPVAKPTDHLEDNMLVEGNQDVMGFPLPFDFRVVRRLQLQVDTEGPASIKAISKYVRDRAASGDTVQLESAGIYDNVKLLSQPDRVIRLTITKHPARAHWIKMRIEDITPLPPPPPGMDTPEARMKAAGLSVDGRILDPNSLR